MAAPRRIVATVSSGLLIGAWLWLVRPSLMWVFGNLSRESARLNLFLFLGIVTIAAWRLWDATRNGQALPRPRFALRLLPAIIFLAGGLSFVAAEYAVGVNRISVVAAGLGSFGLLGLYIPTPWWQRGLAPALLLIIALPFAEQVDIYLGFPARLLTADFVHGALRGITAQQLSAQTILVFENGAAQVDLPCSGVKSLWAGAVLSLAITWLDGRRMDLRWLAGNAVYVALLITANICRVFALVVSGLVLGRPRLADLLHVPLGLVGFALASLALLGLYRWLVPTQRQQTAHIAAPTARPWHPLTLATAVVGMMALYTPRPAPAVERAPVQLVLPTEVVSQPVALSPLETEHFRQQGATLAEKHRFTWNELSGSLLVVLSDTFRAHHLPDRCLAGTGLQIERRTTLLVAPDFPISQVELRDHPGSAAYWFQSKNRITEDYSARVWADLSGTERRWVLVSILFDTGPATDGEQFLYLIRDAVAASLLGGTP